MLTGKQFRNVLKCVVKGAWVGRRGVGEKETAKLQTATFPFG